MLGTAAGLGFVIPGIRGLLSDCDPDAAVVGCDWSRNMSRLFVLTGSFPLAVGLLAGPILASRQDRATIQVRPRAW